LRKSYSKLTPESRCCSLPCSSKAHSRCIQR